MWGDGDRPILPTVPWDALDVLGGGLGVPWDAVIIAVVAVAVVVVVSVIVVAVPAMVAIGHNDSK